MTHSRGMRTAFILRRMRHNSLLLGCVLVAVVLITAVVAALANFSARALPAAAARQLSSAPNTTIEISSTGTIPASGGADQLISRSLKAAFGTVPVRLRTAQWSNPLTLPPPHGSNSIWNAQVAVMDGITGQARLIAGRWPDAARPGQPIGIAIPAANAGPLGLRLGQHMTLTDSDNQRRTTLVVTGLYRPANPASTYWRLDLLSVSGVSVLPGFETFGPFIAGPSAFATGQLTLGQRSWLAQPRIGAVRSADVPALAARVSSFVSSTQQAENVGRLRVTTGLPQLLAGTATSYEVARSLLATTALELLLVAAAALALAASLLASQRVDESGLMAARGVTRRQIGMLALAEAVLLVATAATAGGAIGYWLATPLASAGKLHAELGRLPGPGSALWWPAVVVLAMAALILAWPALMPHGANSLLGRGRRPVVAMVTRAGADVALFTLALISAWQLRRFSVVARSASGSIGIDPVLIAAPSLILIGAALIPLRLVPALVRLGDRLSARGSRLTGALATWEISRRPVRQAGPALLAILAVGTGTLALAQQESWHQSVHDQAAAAAGADVRINVAPPATLRRPVSVLDGHGITAMPVAQFDGGLGGQVLAIDAAKAARVVLLRGDQAGRPAPALWRTITGPAQGIAVPGRPVRLSAVARLTGGAPGQRPAPLLVTMSVQAANGVAYTLPAGTVRADGRTHALIAAVPDVAQASYPLRLVGITATYQMPMSLAGAGRSAGAAQRQPTSTLTVSSLAASATPGGANWSPFAAGSALTDWQSTVTSATLATNNYASGQQPTVLGWQPTSQRSAAVIFRPGFGYLTVKADRPPVPITATLALAVHQPAITIPAIATTSFLSATSTHVGGLAIIAVGSYRVPTRIAAVIKSFPTAGQGAALIVDQRTIQAWLAAHAGPPLPVTSWWLATPGGQVPQGTQPAQVTSLLQLQANMLSNPLASAPQRAVRTLIIAVTLLAILGFSVSVAASVSERRARSALLSALGVSRLAQARQLCLEQALLGVPAAAVGLLVGAILAHLLVPAITLTAQATLPNPPALIYLPAGWAIVLAVLVAALPVLVAALTVIRKPDPAAELRAASAT